ncbi:hypothetical protein V1280_004532 [Bradyrhizobium sp. AZCC 2230]
MGVLRPQKSTKTAKFLACLRLQVRDDFGRVAGEREREREREREYWNRTCSEPPDQVLSVLDQRSAINFGQPTATAPSSPRRPPTPASNDGAGLRLLSPEVGGGRQITAFFLTYMSLLLPISVHVDAQIGRTEGVRQQLGSRRHFAFAEIAIATDDSNIYGRCLARLEDNLATATARSDDVDAPSRIVRWVSYHGDGVDIEIAG